MGATSSSRVVLAFDFASPRASAAIARGGELVAALERERDERSRRLLPLVDDVVRSAGLEPGEIGGIVALRGPGSFTGLRVACATALGLAAAHGADATAVSSLEALALSAREASGEVLTLVDALRGEWFVQRWRRGEGLEAEPLDEPRRAPATRETIGDAALLLGFGAPRFATEAGVASLPAREPRNLAAAVARAASLERWPWDPAPLSRPDYLRAPATTAPAARP